MKLNKPTKIVLGIIFALVLIRLLLPAVILYYVNHQFEKLNEYTVHIGDLDLHLLAGRYDIHNIKLVKSDSKDLPPFFDCPHVRLSVDYKALLKARLVGEIIFDQPKLNFVNDPQGKQEQLTIEQQWQQIVKSLFPLNYNKVGIHDASIHLKQVKAPKYDIYLQHGEVQIDNLRKVQTVNQSYPATIQATAKPMNSGFINFKMSFDPKAKSPTFDLNAELKDLNIASMNEFLNYYSKIAVKSGQFSLSLLSLESLQTQFLHQGNTVF